MATISERHQNIIPENHPYARSIQILATAIRASWGPDTCNESDRLNWSPENPALGQCVVSMLVLLDYLPEAEIVKDDTNNHYWLQDQYGDIDLTREQFPNTVEFQVSRKRARSELLEGDRAKAARTPERYNLLRERVQANLEEAGVRFSL